MKNFLSFFIALSLLIVFFGCNSNVENKKNAEIYKLVKQLTLEEKIAMIHGNTYFTTPPIKRLGIPGFFLSDGPCGVREENNVSDWGSANWKNDSSAYFPSLTALASSWNLELAAQFGIAYGEEAKIRGKNISLLPGINIHRNPLNGRNWEYLSEDPYIVSQFVPVIINNIQSQGVAVCVKHYALNNQEYKRNSINVEVNERALREIYLPGFKAAIIEGHALSIMGAYNQFRGQHASENKYLINDILKGEWGFKGIVVSDWDAAHNTMECGLNGLDVEMGTQVKSFDDYYMAKPMLDSVKAGKLDEKLIDDKVSRILYVMNKLDMFNAPLIDTTGMQAKLATLPRRDICKKIAEESIILLKNENNALPLKLAKSKKIAIIGDNATRKHAHGGGSTIIKAKVEITPLEGIKQLVGDKAEVNYAPGYKYTTKDKYKYSKEIDEIDQTLLNEAVVLAKSSDIVIFIGGLNHSSGLDCEGQDKEDLVLPYKQDEVISTLLKANPNTIIVLITRGPVEVKQWIDKSNSLILTSYIGSEGGSALAKVLFGDVNPSGKLATTFPVVLADSPSQAIGEYPGKDGSVHYNEGLFVGYRYYDSKNIQPQFPFGFGLSYTSFEYGNINTIINADNSVELTFDIKNTGKVKGKEIAQVYIKDVETSVERPEKELKGFSKIELAPGESKTVSILLNADAFKYFDDKQMDWVLEKGAFEILVGASSQDIRLKKKIKF